MKYHFASDNTAGVAPEAWAAIAKANTGYTPGYGEDQWTEKASQLIRELFETDCEVFFTFNGTAANSLALASMCQSYHSVICHKYAHIETDECGAPEFYSNGSKILLVDGEYAKIDPVEVENRITRRQDVHFPKPKVISITQGTELGTVYSPEQIAVLGELAQKYQLKFHMDGARFANAVASLDVSPKEITWQAGVDVLCLGGTKLGMLIGDAVVFFNKALAHEFEYRCKQAGQLASKMRFLTAPWVGMYQDDSWLKHARHANRCAGRLGKALQKYPGYGISRARSGKRRVRRTSRAYINQHMTNKGWRYYNLIGKCSRLMCSWNTTEQDITTFLNDVDEACRRQQ